MNWLAVDVAELDLELLTQQQRSCVLVVTRGTLSQREAARVLGITRSTLRNHLQAAARRLGIEGAT